MMNAAYVMVITVAVQTVQAYLMVTAGKVTVVV